MIFAYVINELDKSGEDVAVLIVMFMGLGILVTRGISSVIFWTVNLKMFKLTTEELERK